MSNPVQFSSAGADVQVGYVLQPVVEGQSLGPSEDMGTCVTLQQGCIVATLELEHWIGLGPKLDYGFCVHFILMFSSERTGIQQISIN